MMGQMFGEQQYEIKRLYFKNTSVKNLKNQVNRCIRIVYELKSIQSSSNKS